MKNVHSLFVHRLLADWKFQYSIWKLVVDWIVALYIVIPALALFLDTYVGWWKEPPALLFALPLPILLPIAVVFCWSGALRVFVEEADQIFLCQHRSWLKGILVYSIFFQCLSSLVTTGLLALLGAPFLLVIHQVDLAGFLWFFLLLFICRVGAGLFKQCLQHRFEGWRYFLAQVPFFGLYTTLLWAAINFIGNRQLYLWLTFVLLLMLVLPLVYRLSLPATLLKDISLAQTEKMKFANVLLKYMGTYAKKQVRLNKHPWLFKHSGRLFKERNADKVFTEIGLKGFLRHRSNMLFYLQVTGIYGAFLAILPPLWQWILWGGAVFFFASLGKLHWLEWINSPFVSLFVLDREIKQKAGGRFLFFFICPGFIFLGLVVTFLTQQWLLGIVLLPAGVFLSKIIAESLAFFQVK
ncbi:ABC transporter permease [Desulfitobacterium hafniense]|uniref:ABC transporter permease n=1 Tax=Desulfitobacterium hafniense TaxID=49338 RepID=A0A0W1JIM6_DESHA|nr:ABC transporter permease [Desulfitobacterium hafniense]KTE91437.1 ABC transporter permease [Desulfitobacterium hafniense]